MDDLTSEVWSVKEEAEEGNQGGKAMYLCLHREIRSNSLYLWSHCCHGRRLIGTLIGGARLSGFGNGPFGNW